MYETATCGSCRRTRVIECRGMCGHCYNKWRALHIITVSCGGCGRPVRCDGRDRRCYDCRNGRGHASQTPFDDFGPLHAHVISRQRDGRDPPRRLTTAERAAMRDVHAIWGRVPSPR